MDGERRQHRDEEEREGAQHGEAGDDERLAHQREHPDGREAHDP